MPYTLVARLGGNASGSPTHFSIEELPDEACLIPFVLHDNSPCKPTVGYGGFREVGYAYSFLRVSVWVTYYTNSMELLKRGGSQKIVNLVCLMFVI